MFKYKLILLTAVLLCSLNATAQKARLTGKITDNDGIPLLGVNIVIVSETNRFISGVTTDFDGSYSISYDKKHTTARYSYIGFIGETVQINGRSVIDVVLKENVNSMDEVVIVGAKSKMSNSGVFSVAFKDLTTANQKLEMKELEDIGAVNLGDALQGQLTGVDMVSSGGSPGAGMSIRIRGTSTLNSSQKPLIVLDGVIFPTNINDDFDFQTADQNDYGALVDIAPEDIESIEVLKDGGATALYGTKGANGVLVITSKRGKRGPTRFNYSYKLKKRFNEDPIPMLEGDDYIALMNDALWNSYLDSDGDERYINTLKDFPQVNGDLNYLYYNEYNSNTNWVDLISQNSISHDHNFSISGGGEKALYRFSLGALNDIGTTIGTSLNRINAKMKIDYSISDKITFSSDFAYTTSGLNSIAKPNGGGGTGEQQVRKLAFYKMPNMSPYQYDSNGILTDRYFTPTENFQTSTVNPLAIVDLGQNKTVSNRIRSVFRLTYKFSNTLSLRTVISFDKNIKQTNQFIPQITSGRNYLSATANDATEWHSESFVFQTNNSLNFIPSLGEKHRLTNTLLFTTSENKQYGYLNRIGNTGHGSISIPISGGVVGSIDNGSSIIRDLGALLNTHYSYDDKYFFSAGIRMDGSSKFGEDERFGFFPNTSIAYRISNEKFLKDISWISDIKLRASYAEVGIEPKGAYPSFGSYATNGSYLNNQALRATSITLDNLKWESTKTSNFGAVIFLFNNNLNLAFDYYLKNTKDLISDRVDLPETTGFSQVKFKNEGDVQNRGYEFSGFWKFINKKELRVQMNWNVSTNKNIILRLPDNVTPGTYTYGNRNYAERKEVGKPIGSFYGYRSLGVFPDDDATVATDLNGNPLSNPEGELVYLKTANGTFFKGGDAKYQDINFDGVIDENDLVYLGNSRPLITGGMGPRITYKSFTLNAFFHFRLGQKIRNRTRIDTENMRGRDNQSTAVLARWRKPGDITNVPRALAGRGFNYLGSDRFVEDGSYVRLKSLSLSYRFPKSLCKKLYMNNISTYISGQDLLTWTKYSGQDPEVGNNGIDNATTPRPALMNLGINFKF